MNNQRKEERKEIADLLVPFSFLQADFTTLNLERATYNREERIQEILESIHGDMEDLGKAINDSQLLLKSRADAIKEVEEILENNRKETLWGDKESNEVMNVSIENFIIRELYHRSKRRFSPL